MQFSTFGFIAIFLPIGLGIYYFVKWISKNRSLYKNITLLVLSLLFYVIGAGLYNFLLIIGYILMNYGFGLLLDKHKENYKLSKTLIYIFVCLSLAVLIVYKILNVTPLKTILPIALSFITFQSVSYLIDIYRGKLSAEKNIICFSIYLLLFTKLVSGPIMTYNSIKGYINNRKETFDSFFEGIIRFSFGLAKKVLIAGLVYEFQSKVFSSDPLLLNNWVAWLGLICFSLYLYYDFSSYSDMAVGLSKIFGFEIIENFNYPYTSFSITDFWRRWHISLSLWFKEYIYFPLGGSKKGAIRTYINIFIVFLVTGIWHGFSLSFVLWGIYFAIFMIVERAILLKYLNKNRFKPLNVLYVLFFVSLSWVLFASKDINSAFKFYGLLFGIIRPSLEVAIPLNIQTFIGVGLGILFVGYIQRLIKPYCDKYKKSNICQVGTFIIALILFGLSLFFIVTGSYSPSVYGGL